MKIVYLDTAKSDLAWFRFYYGSVFPEGAQRAAQQYLKAIRTIMRHPHIGRPSEREEAREYSVGRTPFAIIYRVAGSDIEVMRVLDGRADPRIPNSIEE